MKSLFFLFFPFSVFAQKTDTLINAKAYSSTYLYTAINGIATNGDVYGVGFNLRYDKTGKPLEMEVLRIDLTKGTFTKKIMPGTVSSASVLWKDVFDNYGCFYFGLNSANRKIWRFNFKDSIWFKNLGNGFSDSGSLAYSEMLGRDGHVYFGASSGKGTYWSEYDPAADKMYMHPSVDDFQDYVFTVQGDKDWVYLQVGQRKNIFDYWAVRKKDNYKKKLYSKQGIYNTNNFSNGIYMGIPNGENYMVHDTLLVPGVSDAGNNIFYYEVNNSGCCFTPSFKTVKSYYDAATSVLYYSINKENKSIPLENPKATNTIQMLLTDYSNDSIIYYAGNYYGNWYKYNLITGKAATLGTIGFNAYSYIQYNDSIFFIGGYPSGILAKYNKNKPWTAETFINGDVAHISNTTNPQLVTYFKNFAGFHHTYLLALTKDKYIVGAGTVIRIGNTSSIAAYNITTNITTGYDFTKMPADLQITSLAKYNSKILVATKQKESKGKIYVYDYAKNIMSDSINLNFTDYGNIYIIANNIIGVANNKIYVYDLSKKQLTNAVNYPENSIVFSKQLPSGAVLVKSNNIQLPVNLPVKFIAFNTYANVAEYKSKNTFTISADNNSIIRLQGLY